MNKAKRIVTCVFIIVISSSWAYAQDGNHWQCNIYDYQYDMTVYFSLLRTETKVTDLDGYELAAFVGNECRGVASFQSPDGSSNRFGYLRVRSNVAEGEVVNFKVCHLSTGDVFPIDQTLPFVSQSLTGLPSAPYQLVFGEVIQGDVNGDGSFNVTDVITTIKYILGENPMKFNFTFADMNGDGIITVADATQLLDMIGQ